MALILYQYLLQETSFETAYIPLKNKLKVKGIDYAVNETGGLNGSDRGTEEWEL